MRAAIVLVLLGGCCFTPPGPITPVTTPPVTAPPIPPPVTPTPPVIPTNPTPADSMAACLALCEHAGHCMDVEGAPRTPETADCQQACTVGHSYAMLPPQAYACLNQPTCMIFESCLNAALAAAAAGMVGVPPSGMPTGVPTPPPTTSGAPDGWPVGFPVVAGGTPRVAPPAGPVRVGIIAYAGTTAADLDARYHTELAAAGWTATPSEAGPEARRFTATREATVSVSIYEEAGQAVIQTMQF